MKKTVNYAQRFALALLLTGAAPVLATAQQAPGPAGNEARIEVKIIERSGNDVRELRRTYRLDGMTDAKRDAIVDRLVDSLRTARGKDKKTQLSIIIEETSDGGRTRQQERRMQSDAYARQPRPHRDDIREYHFRMNMDTLADRMNRLEFRFPRDLDERLIRPFENWSRSGEAKPSTVRGLTAYTNNPDRHLLNVRFTAPAKGDVTIVVTTPKGKEVARKEVKDFSGEYVGQLDLGKKAQGTYFITVTQLEDGAVKRIVVGD